jgi:hypothetical protein
LKFTAIIMRFLPSYIARQLGVVAGGSSMTMLPPGPRRR